MSTLLFKVATVGLALTLVGVGCVTTKNRATPEAKEPALPAVGSGYTIDGVQTIVVGAGVLPFEYTARGESLILVSVNDASAKIVVVPDAGSIVKIDPMKPSLTIAGEERLSEYFPKGAYLLLEYDRANN